MEEIFKRIEWSEELLDDIRNDTENGYVDTALRKSLNLVMYCNWISEQLLIYIENKKLDEIIKKFEKEF